MSLSPGPAVVLVSTNGLSNGFRAGLATSSGVVTGNAIYFLLSALGLATALVALPFAFDIIAYAGATYLIWMGVTAIIKSGQTAGNCSASQAVRQVYADSRRRYWMDGMALQLANPKAIIYFAAIVPQFVNPEGNVPLQIAILGITSVLIELVTLAAYSAVTSRFSHVMKNPQIDTWIDRISGAILIVIAVTIAVARFLSP